MTPTAMSKRIGSNMRSLRTIRGLSVEQMAETIGITPDAVRKYERGERSLTVEDMVRFAKILNCSDQNFTRGLYQDAPPPPVKEIHRLDADEHEILENISTSFRGNVKALIIATGILAKLPPRRRRNVLMSLDAEADEAVRCGEVAAEELPRGIEYLQEAIGKLFDL